MNRLMTWLGMTSAALAGSFLAASPALSQTLVRTELVLSVDVSGSIDGMEFDLQRQGYANAFRDQGLIDLISNSAGGIAVTLQYWSNQPDDHIGWFHITDAASAEAFALAIENSPRPAEAIVGSGTNIASAIYSAADLLAANDFEGTRNVIDISADGTQNLNVGQPGFCDPNGEMQSLDPACTGLVEMARDYATGQGITLNGLPILTDVPDLDSYFNDFVVGGAASFLEAATDFDDFERAVIAKIKREVAVPEPSVTLGLLALGLFGGSSLLKKRQDA